MEKQQTVDLVFLCQMGDAGDGIGQSAAGVPLGVGADEQGAALTAALANTGVGAAAQRQREHLSVNHGDCPQIGDGVQDTCLQLILIGKGLQTKIIRVLPKERCPDSRGGKRKSSAIAAAAAEISQSR